jgi:protein SCO1/2
MMIPRLRLFGVIGVLATALAGSAAIPAHAQPTAPLSVPPPGPAALEQIPILKELGIDQRLDAAVPLDTVFVDETGRDVTLAQYVARGPVVLQFAYFDCPMLCTLVQNGLVGALEALTFTAGRDFTVLVVSIDPGDTPASAGVKRDLFLKRYGRPGSETGIHFLTGRESSIKTLTTAIGFRYAYDPAIDQYAHPAAVMVLTPDGRVSRYLFGIEFAPKDLKFALMDAADRRIGTAVDQMLLFCYHYDPQSGTYGFAITSVVRAAGVLSVGALGAFIFVNLRRERRQANAVVKTATGTR